MKLPADRARSLVQIVSPSVAAESTKWVQMGPIDVQFGAGTCANVAVQPDLEAWIPGVSVSASATAADKLQEQLTKFGVPSAAVEASLRVSASSLQTLFEATVTLPDGVNPLTVVKKVKTKACVGV